MNDACYSLEKFDRRLMRHTYHRFFRESRRELAVFQILVSPYRPRPCLVLAGRDKRCRLDLAARWAAVERQSESCAATRTAERKINETEEEISAISTVQGPLALHMLNTCGRPD